MVEEQVRFLDGWVAEWPNFRCHERAAVDRTGGF